MNDQRIAWLLTAAPYYWHPVFSEFARQFPQTILFTAKWSKFARGYEDSFAVKVVGNRKILKVSSSATGYGNTLMFLSPNIIGHLIKFRPHIIFADGFCLWTIFALLLKLLFWWRIVIVYDGSSPSVDYKNSKTRIFLRRLMARFIDACITNNSAGKNYLVNVLGINENIVFARPYLVPDIEALLHNSQSQNNIENLKTQSQQRYPAFLYIGQIIPRKGVRELLEACSILKTQGYFNYILLIVGEGWQQQELEKFSISHNLETNVKWLGQVEYSELGSYFKYADVFIFPTHEDVWGMALTEAMALGKAVICSIQAGSCELVEEGKNGYLFNSKSPEKLAELMKSFIDNPELAVSMGRYSEQLMIQYTPQVAVEFLTQVVYLSTKNHQ
jgi:glycosyltransferase involved in cell wall biosynthesis